MERIIISEPVSANTTSVQNGLKPSLETLFKTYDITTSLMTQ